MCRHRYPLGPACHAQEDTEPEAATGAYPYQYNPNKRRG
jgi:hypothetical protein